MTGIERAILAMVCAAIAAAAAASETISYTYDSRGRLTKVVRNGTVNNNVSATYSYDKADMTISSICMSMLGMTQSIASTQVVVNKREFG